MATELEPVPPTPIANGRISTDLRSVSMSASVEDMQAALSEYAARRVAFRDWLLSNMIEGIHYGYPPGCEPKLDDSGNVGVWDSRKSQYKWYPKTQWTAKKCLYKAGADFICDLMGIRDEYHADMEAHAQIGSPTDTFVFSCKLISRSNGELIGEGRGVRKIGQKGGDANNAIKMAKKSAKVDAVLSAYGLADLFTQDLEDAIPPATHINPQPREDAPQAAARAARVTLDEIKAALNNWKSIRHDAVATKADWAKWVRETVGREFDESKITQWTRDDMSKVSAAIEKELVNV